MFNANPAAANQRVEDRSILLEFWHYFKQNKGAVLGLAVFVLIVLTALFADFIAPFHYDVTLSELRKLPPAFQSGGDARFWLGTDAIGRDILSRLIYGARYSLFIGLVVVIISMILGVIFGLISGFLGGPVDTLIMRVMDIILSIPSILLALTIIAILQQGIFSAIVAIAVIYQPHFVRLTRAAVLAEKNREYVIASRLAGAGRLRLMIKTILPNCMAPIIVQGTLSFSNAILDIAALGFLGQGVQPPNPEWGTMLAEAREFITSAWWIVTFPGLAILITVLAINLVGDGLRDALDPKMKRS
ncbi:MAG: ABC transporter permease subunit [Methylobacteriaceae bacterium]|jgi:dipeptide transport system permease protein|nr:ABC transporter permease subunit [Methylobacteriaceae bacterium]